MLRKESLLHGCYIEVDVTPSNDPARRPRAGSGVAEAEGFEPPVPLGTLAFKVVDPVISGDRTNALGKSYA
jgi:hypothetical protein